MDPKQLLFIGTSLVTISSVYPLLCTPCPKTQCIQPVDCKGGLVDSICGCCSICAKVEGEVCGGQWQKEGVCDSGLTCVVRDRKKKTGVGLCEPAICRGKKCGFREVCTIGNNGLPICTCNLSCGNNMWKPVCGYSNGKQYSNECELYKDECITGHPIGLMQGPCKKCFHAGKSFRHDERRRSKDPCNTCRCFHGEWKCHINSQCPHVMVKPCTVPPYVHGKARFPRCPKGYKCKVQIPAIPEANIPGVAVCVPRIPAGTAETFSRPSPSPPLRWTTDGRKEELPKQCLLVPEEGPCRAAFQRWYYNEAMGKCMTFVYGGCQGNGNNFYSKPACRNFCIPRNKIGVLQVVNQTPAPHTRNVISKEPLFSVWKEVCMLPSVAGPCRASFRRWYYNWSRKKCLKFTYGGCSGNMNNFHTKDDCKKHCMKRKVSTLTVTPVSSLSPSTTSPSAIMFYCRCTQCSGKDRCATSVGCFSSLNPRAVGGVSKRGCFNKSEDYLRQCTGSDYQSLLECCKEDMCNDFTISEDSNKPKEAGAASLPAKAHTSAARCHDSPSDKFYGEGESWEPNDCTICVCRNGTQECLATVCRHPDCAEPLYIKGQCCPMCPLMLSNSSEHNQAELIKAFAENKLETVLVSINHGHNNRGVCRDIRSGKMYLVGQSWQLDQCTTCYCGKSGKAACAVQMCERDPQCKNLFHHLKHCCPMCKDDNAVKSSSHCYDTVTKKYYREAELWQRDDCTSCYCGEDRKPECTNSICPPLECKAPIKVEKRCCRVCPGTIQQGCMYDGQKFLHGDFKLLSDQCTLCLCENGDWNCSKDSCHVSQVQQDGWQN